MKCEQLYGGGGGGVGGVGGGGVGGDSSGGSSIGGIIAGSVVGGFVLLFICFCCLICLCTRGRGRPLRSNNAYVNSGIAMYYNTNNSIFISGTFESYYYQYRRYHGPHNMELAFYPQADYRVHGGGTDDIGTYIITGVYSPRTLRMGLEKHYQKGTGNPSENLGHIVTIQVEWNDIEQQFEGKYYLRTIKHRDEGMFIIRFQNQNRYRPYTIQYRIN